MLSQLEKDIQRHDDEIKIIKGDVKDVKESSIRLDVQINTLSHTIAELSSILKWGVALGFTTLLGFFIFIIQSLL